MRFMLNSANRTWKKERKNGKMKTFKRIASLIIAIAMTAAMAVMPVSAAEDVFKYWEFDKMPANTELKFTSGVTSSITDSVVTATAAKRDQTMNIYKLGWTPAEHPYLEIKWSFEAPTVEATRASIAINAYGPDTKLIGQISITEDVDGEAASSQMKVHKYDLTKAKLTAKGKETYADVTTLEKWLSTESSYITVYLWNRSASGVTATAKIDYVKIYNPGLEATVELTSPATGKVAYDSDTVALTAAVEGSKPVKVEFFVNEQFAGTDTEAPYSVDYKFTEEKENEVYALATLADNTTVKSDVSIVKSMKNGRADFDSYIPPHIQRNGSKVSSDGEFVYTGAANAVNVGNTTYDFIKGGVDLTEKKYLKMRMKLSGTPKDDRFMVSFVVRSPGNTETYCTLTANEDMNGKKISTEYQELVFDLTQCPVAEKTYTYDFTDKPVGLISAYLMRTVSEGTLTIDWIELTDKNDASEEAVNVSTEIIGASASDTELKYVSKVTIENDPAIAAFGTTFIPLWLFEQNSADVATVEYNNEDYDVQNGQTYGATLTDIPAEYKDMSIVGKSFIKTADGRYKWSASVYSSVNDATIKTVE